MKELNIDPESELCLARELKQHVKNPVFMCIGTDKVFADSLGPKVGSLLNENMKNPCFVYGLCDQNINAENLVDCHNLIRKKHPTREIVVVDAAVGTHEQIGKIQIFQGGIVPGAADNKNLPTVGDFSIVGIVADKNMTDFYNFNSSRERLVNQVAHFIANSILISTV